MIDHILGRPSVTFRKYQVGLAVAFWSAYILVGNKHGPPGSRRLSELLSKRLTAWQTVVTTLLWLYVARNFGKIVGLESPEPLANLYTRSYFRASYFVTAMNAGFWSAMRIKNKPARDILSLVFTLYYLIAAEQADEKVRKVRSVLTIEHMRVGWNMTVENPILNFLTRAVRPRVSKFQPRALRIARPPKSSYKDPVHAWVYFDGSISALKKQTKVILFFPGGGFVSMSPRTHDDALLAWAGKTGLPVLALDYRKAPEYPYPYALNEGFDVYCMINATRGRCLGLSGDTLPKIVLSGDSAGGNLAAGVTLMAQQTLTADSRRWTAQEPLPQPVGLVLIYPALDVNIGNWMTDEQMTLIRDRRSRNINKRVVRHKSNDFRKLAPGTPMPTDDEDSDREGLSRPRARSTSASASAAAQPAAVSKQEAHAIALHQPIKTRLATPSLISYVNDRILTPEMMRAMIILYVGPHNRPDFSTEYLLSPVLAPDALLANFPKTYFITGERDPLVDDTVIMAGRIRVAKYNAWKDARELGLLSKAEAKRGFDERDHVHVFLIEGISHGFIQFSSIFPEAWDYIYRISRWFEECFAEADKPKAPARAAPAREKRRPDRHQRADTGASSGDDDGPLEMSLKLTRTGSAQAKAGKRPETADTSTAVSRADSFDDDFHGLRRRSSDAGFAKGHPSDRRLSSGSGPDGMMRMESEDDLLGRRMQGLTSGLTQARPPA